MEKKTIGKFIAVLRKANGMTQKDLADRLFVSDKTVSRWERDECDPDLSLIPAIAELFGITTDELLRGERNNPDTSEQQSDDAIKQKKKSEKQFKAMLFERKRKFDNLTLISIGISLLGLIIGMTINLGLSRGLIAFFASSAFLLAGVICQIFFTSNVRIATDDDDDYRELIDAANTSFIQKSVAVYFMNIAIFAFCLPLVTLINGANFGRKFGSWLLCGTIFAIACIILVYPIYCIFIKQMLIRRSILILNEKETARAAYKRKLLIRLASFCIAIAVLLGIAMIVVSCIGSKGFAKKVVLESPEEFKNYMESSYDEVLTNKSGQKYFDVLRDKQGNVLCECYYHVNLYSTIEYNINSDDRCPITVYTREAIREANSFVSHILHAIILSIVAETVLFAAVYVILIAKKKD